MADLGSLLGGLGVGGNIGKAIVQLELDSKKYVTELNAAQGTTVASTNKLSSGFAAFGGVAKTALLGAGVAAVAFGAYAVKSAIEANDAHLKLTNTFKNNASLADSSVAAFERQADALRDLTGVDDEAIVAGQALLGSFKLTGAQVQELTPRVVDLAAKYDIDLQAAFKAVGKATAGSAGILSRYGIVLDKADLEADAFGTTLRGLGVAQGFAADRAENEPWRLLAASFEEIAEELGTELVPALQDMAEGITDILPALKLFIQLLGEAVKYVGDLFQAITLQGNGFDVYAAKVQNLFNQFNNGGISAIELENSLVKLRDETGFSTAVNEEYSKALELARDQQQANSLENQRGAFHVRMVGKETETAAKSFVKLSKAGQEVVDGLREELPGIIGTVTSYKEAFSLSAADLVKITADWAKIGRTMARDLREIANSDLRPAMREAIAALPPEMRHAWAEGNASQKRAIQASVRQAYDLVDTLRPLARQAYTGGQAIGAALGDGTMAGIDATAQGIIAHAESVVLRAIAAARQAAQADSPSKKMHELGQDLMLGLEAGITEGEQDAVAAAQKVVDRMIEGVQKMVDEVTKAFDKVKGKADDLRSSISSGFAGFLDISGAFSTQVPGAEAGTFVEGSPTATTITAFFDQQVAAAREFAKVLTDLQKGGASAGLLSQIASAGPEALPFARALLAGGSSAIGGVSADLKTIGGLASGAEKALSEAYFGKKIDSLRDELHDLNQVLRVLERPQRLEIAFRPGADAALRQLILSVVSQVVKQPL